METLKFKQYLSIFLLAGLFAGCSLVGLELQEDHEHETTILDPDIHMSAWEFLNEPREDSLINFGLMVEGIEYAGLEEEYSKSGRTFMVLTRRAILRYNSSGSVNSGCYFGANRVPNLDEQGNPVLDEDGIPTTRPARSWSDYPVEQVRNMLLYHIVEGEYSYHNLGPDNIAVQPSSPVDTANIMYLRILNDRNSRISVNNFPGSTRTLSPRTSNLKATNGYVHVFDTYLEYRTE